MGAVSLGTLVALGLLSGLGLGWVHALGVPGVVRTPLSLTTQAGLGIDLLGWVAGLGLAPDTFLDALRSTGTAVGVLVAGWVALCWPTGRRDLAVLAVATVLGVLVLLGPVVHLWYFLWSLPFVAALRLSRVQLAGLLVGVLVPLLLLTPVARERIDRITRARLPADQARAGSTRPVTSPSEIRPPPVPGAE